MDVGPDGSLCRLTSSFNYSACNVKIVKVSDEEQKSTGVEYKLVLIDEKKIDCESASEKSDEEPWTLESLDIELGISRPEKVEDKTEVIAEKPHNKNFGNKPSHRSFRSNNMNRHHKNYVSPGQRNFKSYNNANKSYNRQTVNTDSNNINPWLDPPILNTMEFANQFANFPQYGPVVIESSMNTPVSSNIDPSNPRNRGILGDSPYDLFPPNFQTVNTNQFSHSPNFWTREYPNTYQHPVQNVAMSSKPPYKKHHNKKFWKNRPKSYYGNQNRRGRNERFYRQQQQ